MSAYSVIVQEEDFNLDSVYLQLRENTSSIGAVVIFIGLVRDYTDHTRLLELYLEHYPPMTSKVLETLAQTASERWELQRTIIIHRTGSLQPTDQIVLVAVSSRHRTDAFSAAQFLMDQLKTQAPFWKKEKIQSTHGDGKDELNWVAAKESDLQLAGRWM